MNAPFHIRALHIVLTARCNLNCSYCFVNKKHPARMNWRVLRECLRFGLSAGGPEMEFIFSGGEPMLEMASIRCAVAYIDRHASAHQAVKYSLLTNGTLLDESAIAFLMKHDFEIQISFDGVPESQDMRSPGSFQLLDERLEYLRANHPEYYGRRCSIAVVVGPGSFANLGRSVEYFLAKGVPEVLLAPDFTDTRGWRIADIDRLDGMFAEIRDLSRRHLERTRQIPLRMFRSPPRHTRVSPRGRSLCGIMRGEKPAVDPSGRVFGCGTVVDSYQKVPSNKVRECLRRIRLGHITDPTLRARLAEYRRIVRPSGLFDDKQRNESSYGRCGQCVHLAHCAICPVSIGYIPGNENLNRVPDFLCAYNRISLACRERFWAETHNLRGDVQ